MKIRSKVFLIFIIFNAFWLMLSLLLMQYLAKEDFQEYLNDRQANYLQDFSAFLTSNDNWQQHLSTPEALLQSQLDFHPIKKCSDHRLPQLILLDSNKLPISNSITPAKEYFTVSLPKNIQGHAQAPAYIAMKKRHGLNEKSEKHFIKQLRNNFFGLAISLIIAAAIASLVMSRHLLKPIMAISKACEALKNKQWNYRIQSKGRDELAVLARNLDSLAATLQATETQQKTWLASTSHELKTPLSILQGEIEAMQDGVRSFDASQLGSLMQEVMHLQKLVEDLQASNQQPLSFDFEPLSPAAIIDAQLQKFFSQLVEKDIRVESHLKPQLMLQGDSLRLQQLFSNLLHNSLTYTDSGGRLVINMTETHQHVVIEWQDSTPSVNETELSQLFDYFYRGESSRNRATGGLGLGLAIVKNIVTGHDGEITASTNNMGGLSLIMRFNKII
jgi:two-component system sensor histidine kinase BaeS